MELETSGSGVSASPEGGQEKEESAPAEGEGEAAVETPPSAGPDTSSGSGVDTPASDSKRLTLFKAAIDTTVEKLLETARQEEVHQISEDGLFERALPKLDQLERESEARTEPAWRPTGSPAVDLQTHLVPYLLQQRDYLRVKLKRVKEENAALAESVLQGRNRVESLVRVRDEQYQRWQECTELCRQFQLDEH
ncbi:polyamine-modulated factor 1 [Rhincodon typus]|uniref:polyamine-modulated factor 1 n=1 Tax=Rhincodon typus TaxID=259920 RepID=UPI00202E6B5B|nr:polyamine-modulated factor 1 [Rhincodon typus]